MYNRYIPENTSYARIEPPPKRPGGPAPGTGPRPSFHIPDLLSGREGLSSLSGLLKSFHLDKVDTGDILLLLIMLYLFVEGDDLELVIALGLPLLMGLGDNKDEPLTYQRSEEPPHPEG